MKPARIIDFFKALCSKIVLCYLASVSTTKTFAQNFEVNMLQTISLHILHKSDELLFVLSMKGIGTSSTWAAIFRSPLLIPSKTNFLTRRCRTILPPLPLLLWRIDLLGHSIRTDLTRSSNKNTLHSGYRVEIARPLSMLMFVGSFLATQRQ